MALSTVCKIEVILVGIFSSFARFFLPFEERALCVREEVEKRHEIVLEGF